MALGVFKEASAVNNDGIVLYRPEWSDGIMTIALPAVEVCAIEEKLPSRLLFFGRECIVGRLQVSWQVDSACCSVGLEQDWISAEATRTEIASSKLLLLFTGFEFSLRLKVKQGYEA